MQYFLLTLINSYHYSIFTILSKNTLLMLFLMFIYCKYFIDAIYFYILLDYIYYSIDL